MFIVLVTSERMHLHSSLLAHNLSDNHLCYLLLETTQRQPDLLVKHLLRDLLDIHQVELSAVLQQAHRLGDHAYKGVVPEELAGLCSMASAG